jgi:hypothetical protein
MTWIIGVVVVVLLLALAATIAGSRLPRDHVATTRARFAARPDSIWAIIADPGSASSWRKDISRVALLPAENGKVAWEEEARSGTVRYVMAEADPPRRMIARITSEDLPYGGQWEYVLSPSGGGTELAITERGFVKPALFRFLARYVFGYTSTMEGYLRALGTKLGESVTPEVVTTEGRGKTEEGR